MWLGWSLFPLLLVIVCPLLECQGWTYKEQVDGNTFVCSVDDKTPLRPPSCCERTYKRWLCKYCYETCPRREEPLEVLYSSLQSTLFGQQEAINKLKSALHRHLISKPSLPLVLHFAGDNGVGKTHVASLISEAFYDHDSTTSHPPGLLLFEGEYYSSENPEIIDQDRNNIRTGIFKQLRKCANSIIIFDEVEKVPPRTIASITPFLDKNYQFMNGQEISTSEAIFIFTSDFGSSGKTIDFTRDELESFVERDVDKYWGQLKMAQIANLNIIAFEALDRLDFYDIFKFKINQLVSFYKKRRLTRLCYDEKILDDLTDLLWQDISYRKFNGRGIDFILNPRIVDPILSLLDETDYTVLESSSIFIKRKIKDKGDIEFIFEVKDEHLIVKSEL